MDDYIMQDKQSMFFANANEAQKADIYGSKQPENTNITNNSELPTNETEYAIDQEENGNSPRNNSGFYDSYPYWH